MPSFAESTRNAEANCENFDKKSHFFDENISEHFDILPL